jgi:hypothetical protein
MYGNMDVLLHGHDEPSVAKSRHSCLEAACQMLVICSLQKELQAALRNLLTTQSNPYTCNTFFTCLPDCDVLCGGGLLIFRCACHGLKYA